ncbi:hypothetical protein GW17_00058124 [Ensete ventricosum]|nr:hypothetical protein GW17_00058124 [Ensete ventricosum]
MQGLVHGRRSVRGHPKVIQIAEAKLGSGDLSTGQEDTEAGVTQEWVDEGELPSMIEAARELDCFSAHIRLREPGKSEDKAEWSKGARKRRQVRRGSATQKQSIG